MWTSFRHSRLFKSLLGLAAAQAFALVGLLAVTFHAAEGDEARAQAAATQSANAMPTSELDPLRIDAMMGDLEAGRVLVAQLLERYERARDTDDLYEAVQWMDREWRAGYYQQTGLATRVFERHCSHKVLRWHWLCDVGE